MVDNDAVEWVYDGGERRRKMRPERKGKWTKTKADLLSSDDGRQPIYLGYPGQTQTDRCMCLVWVWGLMNHARCKATEWNGGTRAKTHPHPDAPAARINLGDDNGEEWRGVSNRCG